MDQFLTGVEDILLAPTLGPTQPVQWVPAVLSSGIKCGEGMTPTIQLPTSVKVENEQELSPTQR